MLFVVPARQRKDTIVDHTQSSIDSTHKTTTKLTRIFPSKLRPPPTMKFLSLFPIVFLVQLYYSPLRVEACTAVVVGREATTDGSTYTASSADCAECDFRLAKVPARTYPPNSMRPVYNYNFFYPHVVSDRAKTWSADNLEGTKAQLNAWTPNTEPIGHIPQVARTNALFEGGPGYALLNEHGVAIGESTCPAILVAKPKGSGGYALLDVGELSKIALERAETARKAVEIMGEMAERYGYYGAESDGPGKFSEAGESLMVSDGNEAWVFHVTPDDTGRSAIWAAQRVPDGNVAVVANAFIIRKIDTKDNSTFLYSSNMEKVARRIGAWNPARDGKKIDFAKVFGKVQDPPQNSYYSIRTWRVFTMVNPDLKKTLTPHPNNYMDGYPFSVAPKEKLSREDLFKMYRDHYEGTQFDLTKGEAGGPYGDPDRYDVVQGKNMTRKVYRNGEFGRAISIFRTSFTTIIRSKSNVPKIVGSLLYFAPQQASSSVFVPLYLAMEEVPRALARGNLFRYSNESLYWTVTAAGNWVHRYYSWAKGEIDKLQDVLEKYDTDGTEEFVTRLMQNGQSSTAKSVLEKFSAQAVDRAHGEYKELLPKLIGKYHDGMIAENTEGKKIRMRAMPYPEWWLERVGFFSARETGGSYGRVYEADESGKTTKGVGINGGLMWTTFVGGMLTGAVSVAAMMWFGGGHLIRKTDSHGYQRIGG